MSKLGAFLQRKQSFHSVIYFPSAADTLFIIPVVARHMLNPYYKGFL